MNKFRLFTKTGYSSITWSTGGVEFAKLLIRNKSQYGKKHIVYNTFIKLMISSYAMYLNLRISQWLSCCPHDQVWNNIIKFELWIYKLGCESPYCWRWRRSVRKHKQHLCWRMMDASVKTYTPSERESEWEAQISLYIIQMTTITTKATTFTKGYKVTLYSD